MDVVALEPIAVPEGELLARLAPLPATYARTLKVTLTDAESAADGEGGAAHRDRSQAFEALRAGQEAANRGRARRATRRRSSCWRGRSRSIRSFVVAQYTLGAVHQALGNRWKAAAQFRASTQLDAAYPGAVQGAGRPVPGRAAPAVRPGDRGVQQAHRDPAVLRRRHVGLGDAKAAKGDVDGAIGAYQKALGSTRSMPRVHVSLGKIYYAEKGLYYESVSAYKKAIELDPQLLEARMGLGEVYEDKGLYKEAIEEYRKVIELDGKHTGAHVQPRPGLREGRPEGGDRAVGAIHRARRPSCRRRRTGSTSPGST